MHNKSSSLTILAIDPGNVLSAYTLYCEGEVMATGKIQNTDMRHIINTLHYEAFAIEMVASQGMAVGQTVFDTCVWIGRFMQMVSDKRKVIPCEIVYRKEAVHYLCGCTYAKDSNVRAAIVERYEQAGHIPAVGKKKDQGPLYGISADMWQSLAIAITYDENREFIVNRRIEIAEEKRVKKEKKKAKKKADKQIADVTMGIVGIQ